ncbi:major facilitator superfamily domain-containing protein [Phycomyces nitens]|nr:major facilitator superfamily domain-containing protein [Phycomyces nitens]
MTSSTSNEPPKRNSQSSDRSIASALTVSAYNDSIFDPNSLTLTNPNKVALDLEKQISQCEKSTHSNYGHSLAEATSRLTHMDIASIAEPVGDDDFYNSIPNGGYGWVVAMAGFFGNFILFGMATIWGVFSNELLNNEFKGRTTMVELMGVGTVLLAGINGFTFLNPLMSPLGFRVVMVIGTICSTLGLMLASLSTQMWHLYLTQGLLFGFGASLVYMSVVTTIPQWFTTKRGLAMGISSAGTGFGGLALSPLANALIQKYGIPWAYRIIGFMCLGLCTLVTCLVRTRLPPVTKRPSIKSPIKLFMFKNVDYMIWVVGAVISLTGFYIPIYYIPRYATSIGINHSDSSNIVGICCAMNAIGRLVLGFVGDYVGRVNTYIVSSTLSGIFCMALWPFADSYNTLLGFAVLFGFFGGVYYALAAPITGNIVGIENISSGISILFLVSALSAVGPPISSAIQASTPDEGFIGVQMFSGAVFIFGSMICLVMKIKITKNFFSVY